MSNPFDPKMNRRQFLRQTFAFSALAAAAPRIAFAAQNSISPKPAPAPDPNGQHMFLVGDWGTDKYLDQQIATVFTTPDSSSVGTGMKTTIDDWDKIHNDQQKGS